MYLPDVPTSGRKNQRQAIQFGGLNRTQAASEGELVDAVGVSGRHWPCLTNRAGQTLKRPVEDGTALFAWGKIISVEGSNLLYGGEIVGTVTPGEKQFAVVNTKLCIFPDKAYLDLDTREFGHLDAEVTMVVNTVTFTQDAFEVTKLRQSMGKQYNCMNMAFVSEDEKKIKVKRYKEEDISWSPESGWSLENGDEVRAGSLKPGDCVMLPKASVRGNRWMDYEYPRKKNPTAYATEYDDWGDYAYILGVDISVGTETGHITVYAERRNAGAANVTLTDVGLKAGDAVELSGCVTKTENNRAAIIKEVTGTKVVFDSPVFQPCAEAGEVTVARKVPNLDFICESGNRLWGVSNAEKTIFASALGDPTNFYIYDGATVGNSMLSYAVPVGTDGEFTAICAYGSNVLCWKENCLHKVLGTMPSNYELFTYQIAGVQAGSEGSLQIINEVLYYKGREGVYAYTGGTPQLISAKLGLVDYTEAVGGHDGRNYYVSMKRSDNGEWETLSYGVDTGLWMKETNERVMAFADLGSEFYFLTAEGIVHRKGETDGEKAIGWEAVFAPFNETSASKRGYSSSLLYNKKGYSKLLLWLELEDGAWIEVDVAADGGPFRTVWTVSAPNKITQVIPIRPGRCDRFQVRLRGEGKFLLRNMAREFTLGSVR